MKNIIATLTLGAVLAAGTLRGSGAIVQLTETFDSPTSAASDGWWEFGTRNSNPAKAPYFGWANTNIGGGPGGSGGGLIGRINPYDFYGNVFANLGVMSLTNTLTMSGNFLITHLATNEDTRFGYFQYDPVNGILLNQDNDVIGFYFNEPHSPGPTGSNSAMRIGITLPPNNENQAPFWVFAGTNYSWTWVYNPPPAGTNGNGLITFTVLGVAAINNSGGTSASNQFVYNIPTDTVLSTLTGSPFTAPLKNYTFNGFGIANPGQQGAKASDLTTIFFDNLSYTGVSNATPFIPSVTVTPAIINASLGTNTTVQSTVTVTIPPQLIANSNYTVTVTSGNPGVGEPTGTSGTTNITFPGVVANASNQTVTANLSLTLGPSTGVASLAWTTPGTTVNPPGATTVIVSLHPNVPPYPQVWLPFTSSATADQGFINHNFTESGGAGLIADAPAATWAGSNSLALDGGSYVVASNASDINLNDINALVNPGQGYTMCAWIKVQSGSEGVIAAKSPTNVGPFAANPPAEPEPTTPAFFVENTGDIREDIYFEDTVLGPNVADGTWHHVAAIYDGSQHKLYVDGVLKQGMVIKSANEGANVAVGEVVPWLFTIGETMNPEFPQFPGVNSYFSGEINNFLLWNLALSDAQISSIFQTGPPAVTVGFTQQPASQTRLVGQTATFAVAATPIGTASALTYQWTTNGVPVPSATTASFTTPALALTDSGVTYQCTVGVSNTTVLSQTALLTVVSCVGISLSPDSATFYQQATNQVLAVSFPPELNDGGAVSVQLVSDNPSVAIATGASGGVLTLNFASHAADSRTVPVSVLGSGTANFYLTNATANWCATTTANASSAVTVPCVAISLDGNNIGFRQVAATNLPSAVVSIPLPSPLALSGPISVNLTSSAPSVATPVGAVSGTLTVIFTNGGSNSLSVLIQPLAVGTASFSLGSPSGPGCLTAGSQIDTLTIVQPSTVSNKTETFDTLTSTTTDGWSGHNNRSGFESYGWTNSSNVADALGDPSDFSAGEAGGFFVRTNSRAWFADTTIGQLTLNDPISASGTVVIETPPSDDDNIDITFFNSSDSDSNANDNFLGIEFYEGANGSLTAGRVATFVGLANNAQQYGTPHPGTLVNNLLTAIPWSFSYDPTAGPTGNGQVICSYNNGHATAFMTNNLSAAQRSVGATFNAFGFVTRDLAFSGITGEYYLDNVTYSVGPPAVVPVKILSEAFSAGNQFTMTFESPASTNRVQMASSLAAHSWSTVSGVTYTGPSNSVWTATFTAPAAPAYFRVVGNPSP